MPIPDKKRTIINAVTLTAVFVASSAMDVVGFTEATFYIKYTPGTAADSIEYELEFNTDGSTWHPEPDEVVVSAKGTILPKTRTFVSTGAGEQLVPVLSMPVSDRQVRILVKETAAGVFGTVTVDSRASQLN